MALSLDYMGKFIIVMVTIATAISVIMTFETQIRESSPTLPGQEGTGTELVKVESDSEVYELVNYCHQRVLDQGSKSFTCFLLVNSNDVTIEIPNDGIETKLEFDRESLKLVGNDQADQEDLLIDPGKSAVIRYSIKEGNKIILEPAEDPNE